MWRRRQVRLHLSARMRARLPAGEAPFLQTLVSVLEEHGHDVTPWPQNPLAVAVSALLPGRAIVQRGRVWTNRTLYLQQSHVQGFWRLERSEKRRSWASAVTPYRPGTIPGAEVAALARRLRAGLATGTDGQAGHVLVALQGKLTRKRRFQSMSPVDMIGALRAHDPDRPLVLRLHPKERYSRAEHAALAELCRDPMIEMSDAPLDPLLAGCAYVATQNSAVAFRGYLHRKPAIFFAQSDLAQIGASVHQRGAGKAFAALAGLAPDYDDFIAWYLTRVGLDRKDPDLRGAITRRLRELGWLDGGN